MSEQSGNGGWRDWNDQGWVWDGSSWTEPSHSHRSQESDSGSRRNENDAWHEWPQPQAEVQPKPKHAPPGRSCRDRRRSERETQLNRNEIRQAVGMETETAPLQQQIAHERRVKQQTAARQTLFPEVMAEAESLAKANNMYAHRLVYQAFSQSQGHALPHMPPPTNPWLIRPPPAGRPSSSSSSSRPYTVAPAKPTVQPVAASFTPMPIIPKTPPTPK